MPSKAVAAARAAEGLCVTCGLEPPSGYFVRTCQGCRDKSKLRTSRRRKLACKNGTCEACMRRKRVPGLGNRCRPCHKKYGKTS